MQTNKSSTAKAESTINRTWRVLPALAGIILGACSLAPTYEPPALPVSATWHDKAGPSDTATVPNAALPDWEDVFQDARLRCLIALALENNRDLRIAVARIDEARARYGIQRADLLPSISGSASYKRQGVPASKSPLGQDAITEESQAGLGVTSFEFDLWGRVRQLSAAAQAEYLATVDASRAARISLIAEVARAYLNLRALYALTDAAQRMLADARRSRELVALRVQGGAATALDMQQVQSLVLSAKTRLADATRQYRQAANALELLVGLPLVDNMPPPQALTGDVILASLPAGLPSDLLVRRPDVLAAEQRLKAANANIGAARAAFFPRIMLTGDYGTAGDALSSLFKSGTAGWSFAPQLVLPIFDVGRNKANLDIAHVRKHIAIAEYEKAIQTAFREVADTLAAREPLQTQLSAQRELVAVEERRTALAEALYREGLGGYLDVLDARRSLYEAQQELIKVRLANQTNLVTLYAALGGGWRETAVNEGA